MIVSVKHILELHTQAMIQFCFVGANFAQKNTPRA
jgi:hypothetical protein